MSVKMTLTLNRVDLSKNTKKIFATISNTKLRNTTSSV